MRFRSIDPDAALRHSERHAGQKMKHPECGIFGIGVWETDSRVMRRRSSAYRLATSIAIVRSIFLVM